jgi:hypothetical protein
VAVVQDIADPTIGPFQGIENTDFARTQRFENLYRRWNHNVSRVGRVTIGPAGQIQITFRVIEGENARAIVIVENLNRKEWLKTRIHNVSPVDIPHSSTHFVNA